MIVLPSAVRAGLSGSIWLPIVTHILVDVTQGRQLREIYRDVPEPAGTP